MVEKLKTLLETQARIFGERLSRIEASWDNTGGLEEESIGGDQPSYSAGAGTAERAESASGHGCGVINDNLLPAVSKVEVARGSSLAKGFREISSIKTAIPKLGSGVDFPSRKRRFGPTERLYASMYDMN